MTHPPARTGEPVTVEYLGNLWPGRVLQVLTRDRLAVSFDRPTDTQPKAPIVAAGRITIHRACGDVRATDCLPGLSDPCA